MSQNNFYFICQLHSQLRIIVINYLWHFLIWNQWNVDNWKVDFRAKLDMPGEIEKSDFYNLFPIWTSKINQLT